MTSEQFLRSNLASIEVNEDCTVAARVSGSGPLSSNLAKAIELVEKVGGIDKAKETLDAVRAPEQM